MTKSLHRRLGSCCSRRPRPARKSRQVSSSSGAGNSTVNFTLGYFGLKGIESRVDEDVLLADLQNLHPLLFEIEDFNGFMIGGEYLFGIGRHFEAGVGVAFHQRTVNSDLRRSHAPE